MKKIILSFILGIFLVGCTSTNNRLVLESLENRIPDDNFYFIRGIDRDRSLSTNIRYRGIVYSDKLKEEKSFAGIQIALENMDELWKYEDDFVRQYENALAYPRATRPIRENAKKIFGDDIVVYVDFPMIWDLKGQADFIEENIGKETDEIANAMAYIDIFVEDIRKVDIDEYKKKLFNLHEGLYRKYNYDVDINMDLQDRKYLTYEEIEKNIFYLYKDEPKIKELLKKLKKRENLSSKELGYLLDNFAEYFDSTEIPSILFQVRKRHTNYKEINAHRFDRR
ncbi:hypothetical protein [Fusobacterium perfoetens]|uniref:hypothetical protein n=1 Tax=Fusobacterium perfoetens TaxID=852 RepID=UPI0026F2C5E3|nr:hypothetical protein [Fusobacterium perfoetens]